MQNIKLNKKMTIYMPNDISAPCKLYGYYKPTAEVFNVVGTSKAPGIRFLGEIFDKKPDHYDKLCGVLEGDDIRFWYKRQEYSVERYDIHQNVFSRNTGILETKKMMDKSAIILGCGSVGSLVALELARSGVGTFLLVDTDIVEYHNICRHQCGISEVGEYKVDAVKKRILNINPSARVITRKAIVQNLSQRDFEDVYSESGTILIGCADNRQADVYANMVAARLGASFVSIGFWERALAGEIFYWMPNRRMPCYGCAIGANSGRVNVNNHHVYSNQIDITKLKFEPGISVDINFITCIGIKLSIDILNMNDSSFIPRLLNDLKQYTLVCNTSNPQIGGEMVEIFSYPLQVTTSLKVNFGGDCKDGICRYEK